jgi:hypothetical protein
MVFYLTKASPIFEPEIFKEIYMKNTLHFTFLRTLMLIAFGLFFNVAWGQEIMLKQGFETSNETWNYSASGGSASTTNNGTPNNQRIKSGSRSYQIAGVTGTLTFDNVLLNGYTDVKVVVRISSISTTTGNGADASDYFRIFTKLNTASFSSNTEANADISVKGDNNARWGYNATGVSTNSGTNVVVTGASGTNLGTIYSTLTVSIPNGTTSLGLKIVALNDSSNEVWCVDDIELIGTPPPVGPALSVDQSSLNFGNSGVLTPSSSQVINVSGSSLTGSPGSISVNASSTDFQVSNNNQDWASSTSISFTSSTLSSTPVYVRFVPQTLGTKSGQVAFSGGGTSTSTSVSVNGEGVVPAPVATAATTIQADSFTANWNLVSTASSYKLDVYTGSETLNIGATVIDNQGTAGSTGWTEVNVDQGISSGNNYFQLVTPSSSLVTPVINFNVLSNAFFTFKARTYGGSGSTAQITVSISTDGGTNWTALGTRTPTTTSLTQMTSFDLSSYNSSTVKLRLQTLDANFSAGVGIDEILLTGDQIVSNIVYVPGFENLTVSSNAQFVNGLQAGSTYNYVVRAVAGTNISANSNIISVQTLVTSTTWNGTAWSNGTPSATLDAIVAGNYSTAAVAPQGAFTAKSLTVNSGTFTIASGTAITVENAVVNNAGQNNFVIKSGGNLLQTTSAGNTGAITVERSSAPIVRLDHTLWSSPVTGQNLYSFSPATLTNRFYVYDTATNNFVTTGISSSSTFTAGKGFGVRAPNDHPTSPVEWLGTFKGIPNNGDVPFTLSTAQDGFNLVGNPYPSEVSALDLVNVTNNPSIGGTIYFYAHSVAMDQNGTFSGSNYTTWNASGYTLASNSSVIPNGILQVGQGFFVKASGAGSVTFKNSMRRNDTADQFFRAANPYTTESVLEKHRIWLNLTNPEGTAFNQILIGYISGATEGFDRDFDGLSFGNSGSSLATTIDGQDYSIQARSLPFQASDVVPLTFKAATAGSFTISLSNMDGLFSASQDIFLKDNLTGATHDLKSGSYTFNSSIGTFANRFEVVYQSVLGTPETAFNQNSIVAFKKDNVLNVQSKNIDMASIIVYDVQGRTIYTKSNINANQIELSDLKVQNGVLLLQVTSSEGVTATIKVIY